MDELQRFGSLLESLEAGTYARSLMYTGLRGVGKTVLLMEFDLLAAEAGWATTDVQEVGPNVDFRATFAAMATRLLVNLSRQHRATQRIERALAVVKAFGVAAPGAVEAKWEVDVAIGVADSGDPEQDLADLFCEVGEVARAHSAGVVFLVDEMQNLSAESLSAICMACQAISRAGLPVAVVGAGLPELRVRLLAAKPYADRVFAYAELGRLSGVAARAALVGPAATAGVDFDEVAADRIVDEAAGFPYLIQEYGRELWNYAESAPITTADLEAARVVVKDGLARHFFGSRFELGTGAEQRYLSAMASLGPGPYPVAAVARAFGVDDQRWVSVHRESLIQKRLIWSPRRGQVDFTVPQFAEFLQENRSL
jgi:hypothetical protein